MEFQSRRIYKLSSSFKIRLNQLNILRDNLKTVVVLVAAQTTKLGMK
jgi:hypothetical protein